MGPPHRAPGCGGCCREGARRPGSGPGLRPCSRWLAAGLQTAVAVGGPLLALLIRNEGCREGAFSCLRPGTALRRAPSSRTGGALQPSQPPPGASRGSVLFLSAALGEDAGRKLKELPPTPTPALFFALPSSDEEQSNLEAWEKQPSASAESKARIAPKPP